MEYRIKIREVHYAWVTVQADSEDEALKKAEDSLDDEIEMMYDYTLDRSEWGVERYPQR